MYKGHRIAVVIPVYNEEEFVGDVLDAQPAFVDRVYVVDDCSTDGTWEAVHRRADPESQVAAAATTDGGRAAGPEIVPIRHETNRGRGGAVKTGYRAALEDDADVIAVMDGDGQMDPSLLDSLIDPIVAGEADYAKGNRLESDATSREMSSWRLFGNRLLTLLTRISSGYWGMTDSQNGYTAISRETLSEIDVDGLFDGYGFLNDVLVRLNARDARIVDVPMPAVYGDEESGIAYSTFVPLLSLLLVHRFAWRVGEKYDLLEFPPVAVMYGLASVCGLGGVGYGLGALALGVDGDGLGVALVALSLCLALVGSAFLVERHSNSDLELDVGSEPPVGNR